MTDEALIEAMAQAMARDDDPLAIEMYRSLARTALTVAKPALQVSGFLPDWATYKHSLEYARAEARADALEEAAKVAESYVSDVGRNHGVRSYLATEIAAAIRALSDKPAE